MADFTPPAEGILLAHFIVSDDVERSRRFYTEVLGGRVVFSGDVTYVALANSWIIINVGGGPTDDKPAVTLETPHDPDRVSSFLNIRVADIQAVYTEWSARGAQFLTPPKQHQYEIRCYIRDPDGHLIEVGNDRPRGGLVGMVMNGPKKSSGLGRPLGIACHREGQPPGEEGITASAPPPRHGRVRHLWLNQPSAELAMPS